MNEVSEAELALKLSSTALMDCAVLAYEFERVGRLCLLSIKAKNSTEVHFNLLEETFTKLSGIETKLSPEISLVGAEKNAESPRNSTLERVLAIKEGVNLMQSELLKMRSNNYSEVEFEKIMPVIKAVARDSVLLAKHIGNTQVSIL